MFELISEKASPVTAWRYAADCHFNRRSSARRERAGRRPLAVCHGEAAGGSGNHGVCRAGAGTAAAPATSASSRANAGRSTSSGHRGHLCRAY